MTETIFALSSGAPPAAIAVVRVSGPRASEVLAGLAGSLPLPRWASYRTLRAADGGLLDKALVLWFPGPATATGEDLVEIHLHGGRAVVASLESELQSVLKLRRATPGEFTRRALANGRIDLAEAEGLADLLSAETELQRRSALAMAGGSLSSQVGEWRAKLLTNSALVESVLDFGDEDDVGQLRPEFDASLRALHSELMAWLLRPRAEILRDGLRIVLAGPPNAGKSTLFNALLEDSAAITSPVAGTTRDVLVRSLAMEGVPLVLIDTAGLHECEGDAIEVIGMARAREALEAADLVLWLGPPQECPGGAWQIMAQIDRADATTFDEAAYRVSAMTGEGMDTLRSAIIGWAREVLPRPGAAALNRRQHDLLSQAAGCLERALSADDPLLVAEELRMARVAFDALIGRTTTEDMLDSLFGRFCIGK